MVRYRITPNDRMCQLVCILTWDRQTRRLRMHEMRAGGEAGKRMCESGVRQTKVGALAGCKRTMFNKRAGATTGGKTWLEAGRAGQRCNWMVGYNPPGRSHTSHTLGVALCFEQKQRRNVPCSERRHVPEARFRVLPPRPPSPTPTNYMSVLQTDNIRTTRACQTRGKPPKLEEYHYPRVAPGGARVIMTRGVSLNRTTPHLESLRLS